MMLSRLIRPGRKLKRLWEFRAPAPIWRIYPSPTGKLVVECRGGEKRASFFCLRAGNGHPLWSGKEFVDQWWVGVEAIQGELILLHGYAFPDMPLHKGIYAIDMKSGEEVWSQPNLVFEHVRGMNIIGSVGAYGARTFSELSYDTGEELAKWEEIHGGAVETDQDAIGDNARHPVLIASGLPGLPPPLQEFLRESGVVGPVEHTDQGRLLIFSFHVPGKEKMDQRLVVFRRGDPAEVYSDVIQSGTTVFMPDSFVVLEEKLFYVRQNQTLVAVDLSSEHYSQGKKGTAG